MYHEELLNRIDQLIEKGEQLLGVASSQDPLRSQRDVNNALFQQWRVGALSFLNRVFGDNHTHFQEYQKVCRMALYSQAESGIAILKAAKEDLKCGYLKRLETLVSADIFVDFLDMAEYLLEEGYKHPAASLIGAVLENGLRKMTNNNNIKLKSRENIVSLNQKLADAKIYNRLTQKMVQVWNDIRDNADHGNFDEYPKIM
jgi:hypothetical protein